jgi:biopolymer transport protein ExbB
MYATIRRVAIALGLGFGVVLAASGPAMAWPEGWSNRVKATVTPQVAGALSPQPVLLRLHAGNFDFKTAKPDGSDLRVMAADDRTPLPFQVEFWDAKAEVGLIWVRLAEVSSASPTSLYVYSGNAKATPGGDAARVFGQDLLTWHFADQGAPQDASGHHNAGSAGGGRTPSGIIGPALRTDGRAAVGLPPAFVWPGAGTLSLWVRTEAVQSGTLFEAPGAIRLGLDGGRLTLAAAGQSAAAGEPLTPGTWTHVAVVFEANRTELFINGKSAAKLDVGAKAAQGQAVLAQGFQGLIDEVRITQAVATPADLAFAAESQGVGAKDVRFDKAEELKSGGHNYFGVLFKALTPDAWVVISILAVMSVISWIVMISKARMLGRIGDANEDFLDLYGALDGSAEGLKALPTGWGGQDSTLAALYQAAQGEVALRLSGARGDGRRLSATAIASIRATLDAAQIRANLRLNSRMVLLTIAIAGGPFLGLLGTVIGVMITFAAVAEAGDVNINAIAPGIAAALLATVAGLAVAIPALFGYNYLLSRIEDISTEDQIFVDQLEKQIAERFS